MRLDMCSTTQVGMVSDLACKHWHSPGEGASYCRLSAFVLLRQGPKARHDAMP